MTPEEFENLKVGDTVVRWTHNNPCLYKMCTITKKRPAGITLGDDGSFGYTGYGSRETSGYRVSTIEDHKERLRRAREQARTAVLKNMFARVHIACSEIYQRDDILTRIDHAMAELQALKSELELNHTTEETK